MNLVTGYPWASPQRFSTKIHSWTILYLLRGLSLTDDSSSTWWSTIFLPNRQRNLYSTMTYKMVRTRSTSSHFNAAVRRSSSGIAVTPFRLLFFFYAHKCACLIFFLSLFGRSSMIEHLQPACISLMFFNCKNIRRTPFNLLLLVSYNFSLFGRSSTIEHQQPACISLIVFSCKNIFGLLLCGVVRDFSSHSCLFFLPSSLSHQISCLNKSAKFMNVTGVSINIRKIRPSQTNVK